MPISTSLPRSILNSLSHCLNESASTLLRVIFDGCMKTTSGVSLSDQLIVALTLHPS